MDEPLQLQISNVGSDSFIGRLGVGRIKSGTLNKGKPVGLSAGPGTPVKQVKPSEIFVFDGMGRESVDMAQAGDIVVFSGVPDFNIGDTLVDMADPRPLDPIAVEQPTMSITMGVNKCARQRPVGQPHDPRHPGTSCAQPKAHVDVMCACITGRRLLASRAQSCSRRATSATASTRSSR